MIKILQVKLIILFTALMLCGLPVLAQPQDQPEQFAVLTKIDELIGLAVPELALSFVERNQPEINEDNLQYWLLLEQKRYRLMQQLEMWQQIITRTEMHRAIYKKFLITYADRNWFSTQQIKAWLQLKQYQRALAELRQNLWHEKNYIDADVVSLWRRLIIRSYLNLNAVEDAQRAMRRYRQDYGDLASEDGIEWKMLQAQLLMRTGGAQEAVTLLETIHQPEATALLLLARNQAKLLSDQAVEDEIKKLLDNPELDEKQQGVYWYVRLQLAVASQDYQAQVNALENLFYLKNTAHLFSVFTDAEKYISTDMLWDAYQKYGIYLANQYKLLRGDDVAWYTRASNMFEQQPQQARALLAVLAFNARQPEHRSLAMQQITGLLEKRDTGLDVVNQLFMHSGRIDDIESVPAEVRYRLVDYALEKADLKTAALLMEKLQQPPEGQDLFEWHLRRARILILGGEYQEGVQVLMALLDSKADVQENQIDQYMQVVFDLQNVQQHRFALAAFEKLEQVTLTPKLRRELSYWKAESYQQLKDFQQAAFLFLKSATPLDNVIDPWYHTATFRAAESLAQAGLVEDARRQYLRLLRVTVNTARQAVIRQRLQQLRLKQSHELSAAEAE